MQTIEIKEIEAILEINLELVKTLIYTADSLHNMERLLRKSPEKWGEADEKVFKVDRELVQRGWLVLQDMNNRLNKEEEEEEEEEEDE